MKNYKLNRQEQEELFYKLFPDCKDDYEKWQDFQLLIYNITRRWKSLEKFKGDKHD